MTDERDTMTSPSARVGARVRVRLLRVLPVSGARPVTIAVDQAPIEIGRIGHARSLALTDPEVSRLHALVIPDGDGWAVVDQGSHNGTFVDGVRTERAALHDGTLIRIGKTLILYVEAEVTTTGELHAPADTALLGSSLATLHLHGEIGLVAPHAVPVLVLGETGAGKEVIAHEIHRRSGRPGAFIAVNCAAISPLLAESELFGHVAGAFTGATRAADGLFVAADGGTLFLDEIGELPLDLQPKLLRALAAAEVRAVGATVTRRVDVRVVAATLRDLGGSVAEDSFRADLLNRLSGWQIKVPALRERREDIIAIAAGLLARRQAPPLSADAAEALVLHDWPGNVRELERVLAAALIRAGDAPPESELGLGHLPEALTARLGPRLEPALAASPVIPIAMAAPGNLTPTRDELAAALSRYGGNIARVAEHFEKDRQQIYRWARRYGLDLGAFRDDDPEA
jgi:sigma-54 dependent transcriptional regulator, acetoin dehydrogenase operon transcriptional activator AcoR